MQLVVCGRRRPVRLESSEQDLVVQDSMHRRDAKVIRAHAAPQGMCDNLIHALKLLANQQKDGDTPVQMVVQGLQQKSRLRIMDGLRKFISVDDHAAVEIGDLGKNIESKKVLKPMFSTDCEQIPEAVFREGAGEQMKKVHCARSLTPRMWKTKDGSHRSWMRTGTPSARPSAKASRERKERPCTTKCVEQHKAVKCENSGENKHKGHSTLVFQDARRQRNPVFTIWTACGRFFQDPKRLDLWATHLKSPSAAQATALECTEQCGKAPSVTSEW